AARTTCSIIGSPTSGCNTFGRLDFMRVPWPAVRMTTATRSYGERWGGSAGSVGAAGGNVVDHQTLDGASRPVTGSRSTPQYRLAGQDSNLEQRLQRPLCYRYTTRHRARVPHKCT